MFPRCRDWRTLLLALTLCATLTSASSATVFVPDDKTAAPLAKAQKARVSLWT